MTDLERKVAAVYRFYDELYNQGHTGVLMELAPHCRFINHASLIGSQAAGTRQYHTPPGNSVCGTNTGTSGPSTMPVPGELHGVDVEQSIAYLRGHCSHLHMVVDIVPIAEVGAASQLIVRWRARGSARRQQASAAGFDLVQITDDCRLSLLQRYMDGLGLLDQLPAPAAPTTQATSPLLQLWRRIQAWFGAAG